MVLLFHPYGLTIMYAKQYHYQPARSRGYRCKCLPTAEPSAGSLLLGLGASPDSLEDVREVVLDGVAELGESQNLVESQVPGGAWFPPVYGGHSSTYFPGVLDFINLSSAGSSSTGSSGPATCTFSSPCSASAGGLFTRAGISAGK